MQDASGVTGKTAGVADVPAPDAGRGHPLVSVIVPVYNVERFLSVCLDSILAQSLDDFELICVDDGATDSSPCILSRYAALDSRVIVTHQENGGLSAARNHGMEMARGRYIAFVDGDDYVSDDFLARSVAHAEKTGSQITVFNFLIRYDDTRRLSGYRDEMLYADLRDEVFSLRDHPEMIRFIGAWDRLYRRDFIESSGLLFPVRFVYEDHLFTVASMLRAERISVVPDHLYYYRKNAGGSITDNEAGNDSYKRDFVEIARRAHAQFEGFDMPEAYRYYVEFFVSSALMHQRNIADPVFFAWFFDRIRDLMDNLSYSFTPLFSDPRARAYAGFLRSGDVDACSEFLREDR